MRGAKRHIRWVCLGLAWTLLCLGWAVMASADSPGEAQVRADLERYLGARVANARAEVELPPLASFNYAPKDSEASLTTRFSTRSVPPFLGRVSVKVELLSGEKVVRRGIVSPYVRVSEYVVTSSRPLKRGDVIVESDLRKVGRDRARLPDDALRKKADAVGLRVKRTLRSGDVLRVAHLERVPIVERGDRVTLILESGLLQIRSTGRAQEAGALGDWIRVVNLDSRREISGRVDREGSVHVAF